MNPTASLATPFPSLAAMREAHRVLVQRAQQGVSEGFLDELEEFLQRGQATGVILDHSKDQVAAQTMLDYWAATLMREGREAPETILAEYDENLAPELEESSCPYRGLDAFGEDAFGLYFGRQGLIDDLTARLRDNRLAIVLGPAGCGRSSLVMAGLVPALKGGALPGSDQWQYFSAIAPGSAPLERLAALFHKEADGFEGNPAHLRQLIQQAGSQPALVAVDSFEEAFTVCQDRSARSAFLNNLAELVTGADSRHNLVLVVLSDYENYLSELPVPDALIERAVVHVRPPGAKNLRQAIEKPAELLGLRFEEGVVDSLVQDVLGEPAALLLLQFSLRKLWEKRRRNRITREVYEQVGGGRTALLRCAEAVYQELTPAEQETAKRIFVRLVKFGEVLEANTARVRIEALRQARTDASKVDQVLEKLIQAHLLRVIPGEHPADREVELVHPSLVSHWQRLAQWIEEKRAGLLRRRRLEATAAEWVRLGRGEGGLLDEIELREVERWLTETDVTVFGANILALLAKSREYIEKQKQEAEEVRQREIRQAEALARSEARRARLFRGMMLAVAAVAALAIAAAYWAYTQGRQAVAALFVSEAIRNLDKHPEQGIERALEALAISRSKPKPEAVGALYRAVLSSRARLTLKHEGKLNGVAFSRDAKRVATAGQDGTVVVWNATTGEQVPPLKHPREVKGVAFSPDGKLLATASADNTARLWNLEAASETVQLPHENEVNAVAFSPDGKLLATAGSDKFARLWSVANGKQVLQVSPEDPVYAVSFSPDGKFLATASGAEAGSARIWNVASGQETLRLPHKGAVYTVAFSPLGRFLATGSEDNTARVWSIESGKELLTLAGFTNEVKSVDFVAYEGRLLLAAGVADRTAKVWEILGDLKSPRPEELFTLYEHTDWVNGVAFSPDGHRLATASADGTARIWDSAPEHEWADLLVAPRGAISKMALSLDGRHVAAILDETGGARLWDASGKLHFEPQHGGKVSAISFSPDGRCFATGGLDGKVKIWHTSGRQMQLALEGLAGAVNAITFDAGGKLVAATADAAQNQTAKVIVWDAATGTKRGTFESAGGRFVDAVWNPKATAVAVADWNVVKLWNPSTGDVRLFKGPAKRIHSLAFSPDGSLLVAVGADLEGYVWDVASAQQIGSLKGHEARQRTVAFSRDGRFLATGSDDASTKIWDVASLKELFTLPSPARKQRVLGVAFGPQAYMVAAAQDGTIRRYELQFEITQLIDGARRLVTSASVSRRRSAP